MKKIFLICFLFNLAALAQKKSQNSCAYKGVETLSVKKQSLNLRKSIYKNKFLVENMDDPLQKQLQKATNHCPAHCKQKNYVKYFVKTEPKSTIQNSCLKNEVKEKYRFKKKFKVSGVKEQKKNMTQTTRKMNDWMLSTFINPWLPLAKGVPSKEYSNTLKNACPSCSFYLSYNYDFKKNGKQLDMDMTVQCGDRKKWVITSQNSTVTAKNYWRCTD